jgi:hypothetical protein
MAGEESILTGRELSPANDVVASMCRWGGLLVGIGPLAYAVMLARRRPSTGGNGHYHCGPSQQGVYPLLLDTSQAQLRI